MTTQSNSIIDDLVQKSAINQLYEHYTAVLNAESVATLLFVAILWADIDHILLLSWLMLNIVANGFARVVAYSYHQYKKRSKIGSVARWKKLFIASVLLGGIVWGLAGVLFYYVTDDLRRVVIIIMLISIVGSANGELFPSKISYLAFVSPIYIAMLTLVFSQNSLVYHAIFVGVLLFILFTGLSAYAASNAFEKSLRLRFMNKELIDELSHATKRLGEVNTQLNNQIKIRRAAERKLRKLARHDHLTGLPNRALLNERLTNMLERAERKNLFLAVLFVDLDNFKQVNDTLGHDIGDKLLVEAGERFKGLVRKKDLLVRIGGDEFFVVIEDIRDVRDAKNVAKKICVEFSRPFLIESHEVHISASIGISTYPADGLDAKTLLKNADIALYKVKNSGKNNYYSFSEELP